MDAEMKSVYFAHPVTHYDQPIELDEINVIISMLGDEMASNIEIMNPNQKWLGQAYQNRKNNDHPDVFGLFTEIARACDICVGATFLDGALGAGVAKEMISCLENDQPVYLIFYADNNVRFFYPVASLDNYMILTVEETRTRIKEGIL